MVYFSYVLMTLLMLSGLFLIGLILLQRGRGGGLAGAFGGMGGQSAFGTKAGDVFTRITIGVAAAWILLCAASVVTLHKSTGGRFTAAGPSAVIKIEKGDSQKEDPMADDDLALPADPKEKPAAIKPAGDEKKNDVNQGNKPAAAEEKNVEPAKPEEKKVDAPTIDAEKPKPAEAIDDKPAAKPEVPAADKPK